MLGEGRWECTVDEKGRFPFPAKIRDRFGTKGTWAFESAGYVVLFPVAVWQQKVAEIEDKQQIRLVWQPHDESIDPYGRIRIPKHIRELGELGQEIVVVSVDTYLKVLNKNGAKPENPNPLKPFQDFWEAKRYREEEKRVIYLTQDGRRVIGRFKPEGFFVFSGQDQDGIRIPVTGSYDEFYPGE